MFVESLLEYHAPQRGRRRWATLLSFLLQAVCIGLLVLLPLFYTQALPNLLRYGEVIEPPPGAQPPAASQPEHRRPTTVTSELTGTTVLAPPRIPEHVRIFTDEAPPAPTDSSPFVPGSTGTPGSSTSGLMRDILARTVVPTPPPSPFHSKPLVVSAGVTQGLLISQVKPNYPTPAIQMRVQGSVVLYAVISRNGTIENLRVASGHPLLLEAALAAVRQWRYRPYQLNGQPVEVETQITVNFILGR